MGRREEENKERVNEREVIEKCVYRRWVLMCKEFLLLMFIRDENDVGYSKDVSRGVKNVPMAQRI